MTRKIKSNKMNAGLSKLKTTPGKGRSVPLSKRGPGRPALGDKAKTINVTARVTRAEYELWRRLAREDGVTLVEFVLAPLRRSLKRRGIR